MTKKAAEKKTSRFRFFGDIYSELKKVTWLTRRETVYLTGIVLLVAVVTAAVLGLVDYAFSEMINRVFIGG